MIKINDERMSDMSNNDIIIYLSRLFNMWGHHYLGD
jgi:hypothetical protein